MSQYTVWVEGDLLGSRWTDCLTTDSFYPTDHHTQSVHLILQCPIPLVSVGPVKSSFSVGSSPGRSDLSPRFGVES